MIITHPTGLNWFYEAFAERIERELAALGHRIRRVPAGELGQDDGDGSRILIVNLLESHAAAKRIGRADAFLDAIRSYPVRLLVNYDSVRSHWFLNQLRYEQDLITHVVDVSIASQEVDYGEDLPYYWLPEMLELPASSYTASRPPGGRALAWCVIGHAAKPRSELINALMKTVASNGFAYVPPLQPFGEHGGLDQDRLHRVLSSSELLVWNSYHAYPYHEGLRAIHAVAAGAAPAKIDPRFCHRFAEVPWVYPSVEALERRRQDLGAEVMWRQALGFFGDRPSLGTSLAAIFDTL